MQKLGHSEHCGPVVKLGFKHLIACMLVHSQQYDVVVHPLELDDDTVHGGTHLAVVVEHVARDGSVSHKDGEGTDLGTVNSARQ